MLERVKTEGVKKAFRERPVGYTYLEERKLEVSRKFPGYCFQPGEALAVGLCWKLFHGNISFFGRERSDPGRGDPGQLPFKDFVGRQGRQNSYENTGYTSRTCSKCGFHKKVNHKGRIFD